MHALSLALGLFLVAAPDSAKPLAEDETWPQWRGPSADSIVPGRALPTRWSTTENVVWKAPLPGWGNSTPAIWRDAIFVTTQDVERLLLVRLDRVTGKIVWEREVGRGTPRRKGDVGEGRFHDENNMASPSPVTDGQHVWAHFGNGDLACYDFDGNQLWAVNMKKLHGPYSIWWGHANSPVLVGDLVVMVCMQDPISGYKRVKAEEQDPRDRGLNYVAAFDKMTGKERWFVERDYKATSEPADAYTTPLLWKHDGQTELIVFGANVVDAYEPATGKQLWRSSPFKGNRVISGPTLAGDTVYAIEGMKGPLFAVKAGGKGDVTETSVLWKYGKKGGTPDASSPTFANGLVFMVTNDGAGICVEAASGKEMWKERLGDQFRATPLVSANKVYFVSKAGKTTIVDAAPQFRVVAENDVGEDTIASPAATQGDLYLRTKVHLWRIGGGK
jgi:outer membrane protein assembly factor BamB